MKAFNDDPELHAKIISLAKHHAESDRLVRGAYHENGKGCAVGCMLFDLTGDATLASEHSLYPELLGLPEWLAHLQDYIFESAGPDFKSWPLRLMSAIKLGGDMNTAHHRIHARIQREVVADPTDINERVALLHDRAASGDMPSDSEWSAARAAGRAAAESAEMSEMSARSAAWTAWSAARSSVDSAGRSTAQAAIAQLEQIVLDEVAK